MSWRSTRLMTLVYMPFRISHTGITSDIKTAGRWIAIRRTRIKMVFLKRVKRFEAGLGQMSCGEILIWKKISFGEILLCFIRKSLTCSHQKTVTTRVHTHREFRSAKVTQIALSIQQNKPVCFLICFGKTTTLKRKTRFIKMTPNKRRKIWMGKKHLSQKASSQ